MAGVRWIIREDELMSEETEYLRGGRDRFLAEMTGVDGAYVFPERILQQIWLRGEFAKDALRLNDGRSLRILRRGRWNRLPGPDFRDAEFCIGDEIGGEVIKGDVEVHLRSQDWEHHGHASDSEYDRVVLHVVLFPAASVTTTGRAGRMIPILELLPLLERDLEAYAEEAAVERLAGRPFSQLRALLVSMPPNLLSTEVERHTRSRWVAKVALARKRIEILGWEDACHRRALEVLGYRPNRDTMVLVAERWPLAEWRSGEVKLDEVWASFADRWIHAGVRPANLPKRRLAQYERWVRGRPDWPGRLAECGSGLAESGGFLAGCDIRRQRRMGQFADWRERLEFEVTGGELGGSRLDSMVCDAWLPMLAAWNSGQRETVGLERCWRAWWPGDTPAELMKLAREFRPVDDSASPIGQGTVQGLLGWLAELLDREGRGT